MNNIPEKDAKRFWSKVNKTAGCWVWTAGDRNQDGYGGFYFDGREHLAYKFCYEAIYGRVRKGFVLDHLCRNRKCVRPSHLEPVTNKVNINRGINWNAVKTHCRNGHEYSAENTGVISGERRCYICTRANQKRYLESRESL